MPDSFFISIFAEQKNKDMGKDIKTFNQIGAMAFAGEADHNNALLFLETIKDAIKAAKGEEVSAESKDRFDKLLPVLDVVCNQAKAVDHDEESDQAIDVHLQIETLNDTFQGKENIIMTLDELFHSYLCLSEGRSGEDMAQTYELIMALKKIFK